MIERSVTQSALAIDVARLDAVLNDRILHAKTDADARRWWRLKVDAKWVLAATQESDVDEVAGRLVSLLGAAA